MPKIGNCEIFGRPIFQGRTLYTLITTINIYLIIKIRHKALKKILLVSCNSPKNNRVGRSVKCCFFDYIFVLKCVFYACFLLIGSKKGRKKFRVQISLNKKLVRVGLQETNNFLSLISLKKVMVVILHGGKTSIIY